MRGGTLGPLGYIGLGPRSGPCVDCRICLRFSVDICDWMAGSNALA